MTCCGTSCRRTWCRPMMACGSSWGSRHCEPTGPRDARPDDRLRDAIQSRARGSGLFRRFAPRNDAYAEIAFADCIWLRSRNFWILPVEVFGIGPNTTVLGVLNPDMWLRQYAMISASVALAPCFNSMKAQGTSPHFGSGFATTAANSTAGCL